MLGTQPVIFSTFENLPDPRVDGGNKRHSLVEIVIVTLCATICGAESWTDVERFGEKKIEWFKKFLKLENGIPSHDTIGRVFAALDTAAFNVCLQDWIEHLQLELRGQGVHIDGKTVRHSFDAATNRKALHLVSAWADGLSICLGQVATDEKSNEITAVPMLLELLEIRGAVITLDAMNCQRKTVAKIRDKQADYVITVKKNQGKLHKEIEQAFLEFGEENYQSRRCRSHRTTRKTRGRIEERTVTVAAAPRHLKESGRWADIATIGMVYRHRESDPNSRSNQEICESDHVTYFISSLPPKAKLVSQYVNKHWTVENSLHWVLDVTFTEDASRIRKGNGQELMGNFRRLALSILKRDTSLKKESIRGKRLIAGWNNKALEAIIAGA
ncbi:MAG TPA: ISAs1 family transposase [Gammaproteobacteria bacterium]|nr:ISAs1 family transposase [Gammaproteobacteria bacterium]